MMRFYFLGFFALCQLTVLGQSKTSLADSLFNQQEYVLAGEAYNAVLREDSTDSRSMERLAICFYHLGSYKAAKDCFHIIESLEEHKAKASKHLAKIYEYEGHVPKTIKYYLALLEQNPDNPIYLRKLAANYLKGGEPTEAFQYYAKAYKMNDKDILTVTGLTDMLLSNKQFELADSILRAALAYDPENVRCNLSYATSKYRQKQYDTTAVILYKASLLADLNNYYNKMLGYSYMQIDSLDRAIVHLEKSLLNERNPEKAHYYLATAYEIKKEKETAIFHYKKAIETGISKEIGLYHRLLASSYNADNNQKKALEHYQEAYRFTENPEFLFYIARASDIYYKDKNIAINYYKKYSNSNHGNAEFKNYASERRRYLREQIHFGKN